MINNVRQFDLVRYMRLELREAELITDDEYRWLCAEAPLARAPGGGSPSPRRLEDYDQLRLKLNYAEDELKGILAKPDVNFPEYPAWVRERCRQALLTLK